MLTGHHCEYSPSDCLRAKQSSLSIKCPDPNLCLVNDTEKLRELNQLSVDSCQTERHRLINNYFICLNEQEVNRCVCPQGKSIDYCFNPQYLMRTTSFR